MHHRNRNVRAALSLAVLAVLAPSLATAQDSGSGVDLHFGNALSPSGTQASCDPVGMSWLTAERKRTPGGHLYLCAPESHPWRNLPSSPWLYRGTLGLGYLDSGDEHNTNWLRFNNWDKGVIGRLDLSMVRPVDGAYFDLRASRINGDNQYYKLNAGRAGHYRIQAFARSQVNVTSGSARSIWDGVGSDHLSLQPGLTPGGSSIPQVAAISASSPEQILKVVRDKIGVSIDYRFDKNFTAYAAASHEQRDGARPFGGPFFFAFIFPGTGGVYETPRPIDDSTLNFSGGLRYVGNAWNWDVGYNGSMFRNGSGRFSYEIPFAFAALVPGFGNFPLTRGEFAYEPENDYHNIRGSLTRKIAGTGQFTMTASLSSSRQDDNLLAPMNCASGQQFGLNVPPFAFQCSDWNNTAALSRTTADLRIDSTLVNAKLVMRPTETVTAQGTLKFHRQDYKGTYFARNPLTGQYGYIAENGAQGSSVPMEMGVWDPILFPGVLTRIRNLPLDKEIHEADFGLDWRMSPKNTLSTSLTVTRTERTHREVERQDDLLLKFGWTSRSIKDLTLRANYSYLDRKGRDYNYDPYHFPYSLDLPGFIDQGGIPPHTLEALRKYDVAGRKQHKATLIATYALPGNSTLSGNLRGDLNDYDAEYGRQGYDTWGGSLQWDWQPSDRRTANLFVGYDRSTLDQSNINELAGFGNESWIGGDTYREENRWWVKDRQRNYYAGANFMQRLARGELELGWGLSDSRGLTNYRFNSPGALAYPALAAAAGSGFAPMVHKINTFTLSWQIPLNQRVGLRLFNTYETGKLADWHYFGLEESLVTSNRVYLDAGPSNYSVNMVGLMMEIKL